MAWPYTYILSQISGPPRGKVCSLPYIYRGPPMCCLRALLLSALAFASEAVSMAQALEKGGFPPHVPRIFEPRHEYEGKRTPAHPIRAAFFARAKESRRARAAERLSRKTERWRRT